MCGSVVNRLADRRVETDEQRAERAKLEWLKRIEKLKEAVRVEEEKEVQRRQENIRMRTNVRHGFSIYNGIDSRHPRRNRA